MYVLKRDYLIDYASFFNYSTISSNATNHPISDHLIHQSTSKPLRHRRGAWLSASSTAILGICSDVSESQFVLAVYLHGKVLEEHFISKLHFSWPQMTCGSECPTRGSRVVFVSYKDSTGQIQKFAMRFVSSSDSQTFIDALKEILQHMKINGAQSSKYETRLQSETEFITLDGVHERPALELDAIYPAVSDTQMHSTSSNGAQCHITSTGNGFSSSHGNLPSSFTAFLADCTTGSQEGSTDQLQVPKDPDMLSYLSKHMPSSAFQAMLNKMEKFISETGGNLGLQIL